MKIDAEDKILAVLRQESKNIARYELFGVCRNAIFDLFTMLMVITNAAIEETSLEITSKKPIADTIFYHLNQKLTTEKIEEMLKHSVRRSVKLLKRRFGGRKFAIAIDFTEEMYYGDKSNPFVVGTKPKAGTYYAYRYLTMNIVVKGCRFLLFAYPFFNETDKLWLVNRALVFLEELGVQPYLILLDREFYTTDMVAMIGEKYHYIIPVRQDSKFENWVKRCGKLPALVNGWRLSNNIHEEVETNLVILEETKNNEMHVYGYITNLPVDFYKKDPYVLSDLYSRRWGIETSHRVEDNFRLKTTSKNGVVRYLFFVIGLLLYNLWVLINLLFCLDVLRFSIQIKVDEMKKIVAQVFNDFWDFICSPERWFAFGVGGELRGRAFLLRRRRLG